jgi:hypothetical protein
VTKLQVMLTSLVAAIPGALLAYFMVMVFLNFGGGSSGFFKGLAGVSLLLGAMLALMPVGILVFAGPKSEKKKPKPKPADGDESETEAIADSGDEVAAVADSGDDLAVAEEDADADEDDVDRTGETIEFQTDEAMAAAEDEGEVDAEAADLESTDNLELADAVEADDDFEMAGDEEEALDFAEAGEDAAAEEPATDDKSGETLVAEDNFLFDDEEEDGEKPA